MHHLNYKRWTSYPQSANVICTWTLWLNGCEANYCDPVIVVIIFGGVSFDIYKPPAASLMAPKLSPQSCVRSTKEYFLSESLFLRALRVTLILYVVTINTQIRLPLRQLLSVWRHGLLLSRLEGKKKKKFLRFFTFRWWSDVKRVRMAIPNTSHYKKKKVHVYIYILSLKTGAVWSIMTEISNFSKCLHFHTLGLKGKYSKSHT